MFQAYLFQQEVQVENKDFRKIINHCFQIVKSKNKVKDNVIVDIYKEIYGDKR